ncbi:MAG: NfeD family protein [Acidobacteriota bacterium]|jgi:membrane protein implicated in regulation of membrane protease activity
MAWELPWEWFWVVLSAFLVVGEVFTAGFFILPFGIGAAIAAALAFMGIGLVWQWAAFLLVSVALLLPLRRFADHITPDSGINVAANRVIGQVGMVLEAVQPHGVTGRVRIGSEEWRASSDSEETIPEGTAVEVERIDGTHVVVRPRGGQGGIR